MELYDAVIKKIEGLMGETTPKHFDYNEARCSKETASFELIMARDAAYELGGSSLPTANCTCITSSTELVDKDEVIVYGKDLYEIESDVPYCRIAILRVAENFEAEDKDVTFRAIQDIDFVKYHVFPDGFMARTSALSNNEQVRISKAAVKDGISFEQVGNSFIKHYKENPNVLNVKLIFATTDDVDYKELRKCAKNTGDITKTLSKIIEGMPTDCHSCNLKPICDEVEGMRELHFGKAKKL